MNDQIIAEVKSELDRQQNLKHGGNTEQFDQSNSQNDWVAYVTSYAGRAAQKVERNEREGCDFRENMVKVAALAISAIRCHDKGYC